MQNERMQKLVSALPAGFGAALVQTEANLFYLLDFDAGDAGALLLFPDEAVYIIDSRYIELAREQVKNARVLLEDDLLAQIQGLLADKKAKKLYLENQITVARYNTIRQKCDAVELDVSATLSDEIENLRAVKDAEEIRRMQQAQQLTDACFSHIQSFIRAGVREVDLVVEMESWLRRHGAEKMAFDTICIAGKKTSLPHGVPGENTLQPGDFLTLDFGAKVCGYCTDMTRTVAVDTVSEEKRRVYDTVLAAHLAGIANMRAGAACKAVDAAARTVIDAAGYKGAFGHGLGHGVGIRVHEAPRLSPRSQTVLAAGMMVTVEPGCYLPGQFGCRIEDTVLVTAGGCEPLPSSTKELLVLG